MPLKSGFSGSLCVSSFQRKVEMFHNTQAEFGDRGEGYVSKTIALVNCCPPLRYDFVGLLYDSRLK